MPFEHLHHQVLADRPVGAGELSHETLGIGVSAE